jgi:hypothetical protein
MEAFVYTAFDDEARWNALYFGVVLNCSVPILEALLYSVRAKTRLSPDTDRGTYYYDPDFAEFLRTIISDRLSLEYPDARPKLPFWFWKVPSSKTLSILVKKDLLSLWVDITVHTPNTPSPYMFRVLWHFASPKVKISYGDAVYRSFDWRYFSEILEERVRVIGTMLQ